MKWLKTALAVLLLLAVALPFGTGANAASGDDRLSGAVRIYKTIRSGEKILRFFAGSGFFIRDGYVITAGHVTEGGGRFEVRGATGKAYIGAAVVEDDEELDLALLKTHAFAHAYYELADKTEAGSVTLIGNSDARGESFVPVEGEVDRLSVWCEIGRNGDDIMSAAYRTVITAESYPGYSGAPVLDADGDVIGVALAARTDNHWAILARLSDLQRFIADQLPSDSPDHVSFGS